LDIPENPGSSHIGGVLAIGHDENVYLITGDGESCFDNSCKIGVENSTLNTKTPTLGKVICLKAEGGYFV
jgi:glucose/arabinose dehydrogenase